MGSTRTGEGQGSRPGLGIIIGALGLVPAVILAFYATRHADFESDRGACITALSDFKRTLAEIQYTEGVLTSDQAADFTTDAERIEFSCFDDRVLASSSGFANEWYSNVDILTTALALRGADPSSLGDLVDRVADGSIGQQIDAINAALLSVKAASGPGLLPVLDSAPSALATFPPVPDLSPEAP